jgi:hypothetical protein
MKIVELPSTQLRLMPSNIPYVYEPIWSSEKKKKKKKKKQGQVKSFGRQVPM